MRNSLLILFALLLSISTAFAFENRVGETTTVVGTGTINLAGVKTGYVSFNSVYDTNDTMRYLIQSSDGSEWEIGTGTFTDATPDTLARTTVEDSSNSGSKVSFSAGTKNVYHIASAADLDSFLAETEIDASSELLAIMDDETGTGYLCFNTDTDLIGPRIKNGATSAGALAIYEDSDDGTNKTTITVPAMAGDISLTFPADDGDAGEQLQTNGSGVLTWEAAGSGGMTNPMTTAGDIIYGGVSGTATRLAKGANNTLLGVNGSGTLGWQSSFSLDDSAAQFFNAVDTTKKIKLDCSALTSGRTITLSVPDQDTLTLGSGGGTSAGSQYDIQIADDSSGFAAVTGEFKYQSNTLYVGTGGLSQAKTSGQAGAFTLYSNNSTDTTGAGLKGPSATLANSYYLIFPSTEPASANSIWAHAAASSHNSAGSWLVVGTGNNNLVQLDGSAKLPAVDGSQLTNISATPNDTETIYDADGGSISVTKNNTIVITGAACSVTPLTPAEGVNLMVQNIPGTTGAITIVNLSGVYYGKSDASGYITVNHKYVSGGANTDRIVLIGIDSTHYIVASATGTWTDTAP